MSSTNYLKAAVSELSLMIHDDTHEPGPFSTDYRLNVGEQIQLEAALWRHTAHNIPRHVGTVLVTLHFRDKNTKVRLQRFQIQQAQEPISIDELNALRDQTLHIRRCLLSIWGFSLQQIDEAGEDLKALGLPEEEPWF